MRKVFIVNDSGHDYSAAAKYGKLIVLSKGMINKYAIVAMKRAFEETLSTSSPEDCILQSGPSVMSALACAMFAALHGRLNLLLWFGPTEDTEGRYLLRRVKLQKGEKA